jgi:hypothetical protein
LVAKVPRATAMFVVAAVGLTLSSCSASSHSAASRPSSSLTAGSSTASHAATQLSIRQVYESSDTGLTGVDIQDTGSVSLSPMSLSPTPGPGAESPSSMAEPTTPETTPSAAELAAYAELDCSAPTNQKAESRNDDPKKFLVTCGDPDGSRVYFKYLLHPTLIRGSDVLAASAQLDSTGTQWNVQLTFKPGADRTWAKFTAAHVGTATTIVLNGNVFSAEVIQSEITGPTQITGTFTKKTASDLAKVLSDTR